MEQKKKGLEHMLSGLSCAHRNPGICPSKCVGRGASRSTFHVTVLQSLLQYVSSLCFSIFDMECSVVANQAYVKGTLPTVSGTLHPTKIEDSCVSRLFGVGAGNVIVAVQWGRGIPVLTLPMMGDRFTSRIRHCFHEQARVLLGGKVRVLCPFVKEPVLEVFSRAFNFVSLPQG